MGDEGGGVKIVEVNDVLDKISELYERGYAEVPVKERKVLVEIHGPECRVFIRHDGTWVGRCTCTPRTEEVTFQTRPGDLPPDWKPLR